ncbi:hypothetical protein ASG43_05125 [Aureimonas sp. Leaf454]|nr:hypothetical protein ASG43_05125 [Aureimonas sp. Leaf454]
MQLRHASASDRTLVPSPITLLSCVRRGWTEYRVTQGGVWEWVVTDAGKAALETTPPKPRRRRRTAATETAEPD